VPEDRRRIIVLKAAKEFIEQLLRGRGAFYNRARIEGDELSRLIEGQDFFEFFYCVHSQLQFRRTSSATPRLCWNVLTFDRLLTVLADTLANGLLARPSMRSKASAYDYHTLSFRA